MTSIAGTPWKWSVVPNGLGYMMFSRLNGFGWGCREEKRREEAGEKRKGRAEHRQPDSKGGRRETAKRKDSETQGQRNARTAKRKDRESRQSHEQHASRAAQRSTADGT
ncbi:unnamed protein product [[Candida] boidinii]|nr:unnamed protein product [[Candida] boidinii]